MEGIFEIAAERTYLNEGGYVNDPDDSGGETNGGISKRTYPNLDIKNLTKEKIFEIYKKDYWDKYGLDNLQDQLLANQLFDMFINMNPHEVALRFQTAICLCGGDFPLSASDIDKVLGSKTFKAANGCYAPYLLCRLRLQRIQFYVGVIAQYPNKIKYLHGWIVRSFI
jgi:lysozyme family protein